MTENLNFARKNILGLKKSINDGPNLKIEPPSPNNHKANKQLFKNFQTQEV